MKEGFESLGRIRAQGIALLLVTFVVGALAGVALERVRVARRLPWEAPRPFPGDMREPPGQFMPAMFRELNLTDQQERQIRRILQDSRQEMDSVLNLMLPRLNAVTDSVRLEIRAVLTPEQAEQLDQLMSRARRRRGVMPGGPGGPDGPGGFRGRGVPPPQQP